MKIISWNVNGIRACTQKGLFEFLDRENPDIFCIQETKAHPDQLADEISHPEGRFAYWSTCYRPGYSGTLTLTIDEVEEWQRGIGIRKFDSEGRFVVTRHPGFWLYNVYFPNGGSGEERHNFKQEFLERFRLHLKKHLDQGEEVIVLGDYNVAHEDIDVYDPKTLSKKSGFLPEEREWLTRFLQTGFHDTFREHHPEEEGRYSWWSYRENARLGNRGWRIDMICVSPGLVGRVKRADILQDQQGSDHCPILIELEKE